jgi:hypothetical protein
MNVWVIMIASRWNSAEMRLAVLAVTGHQNKPCTNQ